VLASVGGQAYGSITEVRAASIARYMHATSAACSGDQACMHIAPLQRALVTKLANHSSRRQLHLPCRCYFWWWKEASQALRRTIHLQAQEIAPGPRCATASRHYATVRMFNAASCVRCNSKLTSVNYAAG
jgi:hypothetical protein